MKMTIRSSSNSPIDSRCWSSSGRSFSIFSNGDFISDGWSHNSIWSHLFGGLSIEDSAVIFSVSWSLHI